MHRGTGSRYSPPYDLMHAMHEILDASNSVQPFQRNFVTWQDPLGSSASRWCGSEMRLNSLEMGLATPPLPGMR